MRFWDSSAIVPLLVQEASTSATLALLDEDPALLAWWGTPVEIASALARLERAGEMAADDVAAATDMLRVLSGAWHEVVPGDAVRRAAERLLRVHPLRSADALQLAAALVASGFDPPTLPFVCLDSRLSSAARREGFPLLTPGIAG